MISNNATIKLNPLKTFHELDSESEIVSKGQGSVREGPEGDFKRPPFGSRDSYNSRTVVSNKERDKADFRPNNRNKFRDERMARGGSYRCGNPRGGRSGFNSDTRKNKVFVDSYMSSQKYDSAKDTTKTSTGKLYEAADAVAKTKQDTGGGIVLDDCRISKVLRRLAREDEPDKFIVLAKQLQASNID